MRRYLLIFAAIAALVAAGVATAVATTGTVSACATASVPAQTLSANGTSVATLPGASNSQCVTTTYTVPTVTVTTTVAAATTRWFTDGSYMNLVVPNAPVIDPNSAAWINLLKQASQIWTNGLSGIGGQWSATVYHSTSTTPNITVSLTVPYMGSSTITFPCASNWVPTADSDAHMIVIAPDGGYWEFQGLNLSTKTAHSVARGNVVTGDGVPTAQDRISELPTPVGLIRPEEIAAGVIPHALRAAIGYESSSYRWPAIQSDGSTAGGIPSGAHLWLPRSVDISTLSTYQKIEAKALQEYGVYVGDNGPPFSDYAQSTADGVTSYPFTSLTLPQSLIAQMVVLAP